MRHHITGVDHALALGVGVKSLKRGHKGAHLIPDGFSLGRQVNSACAPHPINGQPGKLGGRLVRIQQCAQHRCPPQVQVGVMLPGKPNASVHLDAQIRTQVSCRTGNRSSNCRCVGELLTTAGCCPGCVPHRSGGQLGSGGHVGAMVLDTLEHRNGAAKLLPHLGVLGGVKCALLGHTDSLRCEQHACQVHQHPAGTGEHNGGSGIKGDPGRAARRIKVLGHLHGDPLAHLNDNRIIPGGDDECPGMGGTDDGPRPSGGPATVNVHLPAKCHRPDSGSVGEAGQQCGADLI